MTARERGDASGCDARDARIAARDDRVQRRADCLRAVREGAPLLDPPPPDLAPATLDEAYATAALVVAALERRLGPVRGYKVGATSPEGQRLLGLTEPFYGCECASAVLADGATWATGGRACTVEAEVGFVLARDLPAQAAPYALAEVRRAVARAVPLLEINRPAFARPFEVGGLWLVADDGVTQALVHGVAGREGRALGTGAPLAAETVRVLRNGSPCATGAAHVVLGDPWLALQWLANALPRHGRALRAGDVVASGAMTPPIPVAPGDEFVAEYSTLGAVRVRAC